MKIIYPFTNPDNYEFNSSKIEIVDGIAKLKKRDLSYISLYVPFNNDLNAVLSAGSGIGAGTNDPQIIDNPDSEFNKCLDLSYNDVRYVDYDGGENAGGPQKGCISLRWRPNYSGTPQNYIFIFDISDGTAERKNRITIYHTPAGQLLARFRDKNGNILCTFGDNLSVTKDYEYHIELNYNLDDGENRLFVDGVQSGNTDNAAGIRENNNIKIRVGGHLDTNFASNFYIDEFIIYNEIQHTENFAKPVKQLSSNYYPTDNPVLKTSQFVTDKLINVSTEYLTDGNSDIRVIVNVQIKDKYWNGSVWTDSDGTYDQSMSVTDFIDHCGSLITESENVYIKLLFHSEGDTTAEISNLEIEYDFAVMKPGDTVPCIIYGWVKNANGELVINEPVEVFLSSNADDGNYIISDTSIKTVTNEEGYFEIPLYPSEKIGGRTYKFMIGGTGIKKKIVYKNIQVPDKTSENLTNLLI